MNAPTREDYAKAREDKTWTQLAETMRQQASTKPAASDDDARAMAMQAMMEKTATAQNPSLLQPQNPSRLRLHRLKMMGVGNPEQTMQALAGKV